MLELMIGLFLVGSFAIPLSQFPMRAVQEELRSAYGMQAQRLADLAFAEIKEKLHKNEISWKEIAKPRGEEAIVHESVVDVSFDPLCERKFVRIGTLHSVGKKKGDHSEEWRLATLRVKITPEQKKSKLFRTKMSRVESRVFNYQVLIHKTAAPADKSLESSNPLSKKEGLSHDSLLK